MGALTETLRLRRMAPIAAALPFDLDDPPTTADAVLARALDLFGPEGERWIQHKRRDRGGYCAIEAIQQAAQGDPYLRREAEGRLRASVGGSPMLWNDSPGKPFAEIRAGFMAAITSGRPTSALVNA